MSCPHHDPIANGKVFGSATVTVDLEAGDCIVTVERGMLGRKKMRLHSLEEIQGAYAVQNGLGATDPNAADAARALKFAGQQLQAHQRAKK